MEAPKFIIYDNKKFWVSGSGKYYYYCPYKNGVRQPRVALHRYIWEKHNQATIPEKHHIHHIDGDPLNNDPTNLACVLGSKHNSDHVKEYVEENHELVMHRLGLAQEKAKEWHASEEGKIWHSKNAKQLWKNKKASTHKCKNCHNEFQSTGTRAKFCSNSCVQKFYYRTKKYHEDRTCTICGQTFSVRSNESTECCSYSCAAKNRWRNRRVHPLA